MNPELPDPIASAPQLAARRAHLLAEIHGDPSAVSQHWLLGLRSRRLAGIVIASLAAVSAVLSVSAANEWWFFRNGAAPPPIGRTATVSSGNWGGVPWELTAYVSTSDGLCIAFTPHPDDGAATEGAALGCGAVGAVTSPKDAAPGAFTYLRGYGNPKLPEWIAGAVADSASQVEVRLANGTTVSVPTLAAPSSLDASVRFWITQLPCGVDPVRLVALKATGAAVATQAIDTPPGPRTNCG